MHTCKHAMYTIACLHIERKTPLTVQLSDCVAVRARLIPSPAMPTIYNIQYMYTYIDITHIPTRIRNTYSVPAKRALFLANSLSMSPGSVSVFRARTANNAVKVTMKVPTL